jgi:hypothetical protein
MRSTPQLQGSQQLLLLQLLQAALRVKPIQLCELH